IVLDSKSHVAVRSAAAIVMQRESVGRRTAPPRSWIMPLDVPPVVVAIQRAHPLRQQGLMQTLDDRNRLIPLNFADRTRTKINIRTESSRFGLAREPYLGAGLPVTKTAVDRRLRRPQQSHWLLALADVVQLVLHHLGEEAFATVGRLHRDTRNRGHGHRSTWNREPPAVRATRGDPVPVHLKAEIALWLEDFVHGLPALRDVIVVEAAHGCREKLVSSLWCGIHQRALGQK